MALPGQETRLPTVVALNCWISLTIWTNWSVESMVRKLPSIALSLLATIYGNMTAEKAAKLQAIPERIAFDSWQIETVKAATIATGVRAWAEIRGTMINCQDRAQLLQACPICPEPELAPTWQAIGSATEAAALSWPYLSEAALWRYAGTKQPAFADLTYRKIGPQGIQLQVETAEVQA